MPNHLALGRREHVAVRGGVLLDVTGEKLGRRLVDPDDSSLVSLRGLGHALVSRLHDVHLPPEEVNARHSQRPALTGTHPRTERIEQHEGSIARADCVGEDSNLLRREGMNLAAAA